MDEKKLGQALVKAKKLTADKLKYALAMHEKIGGDFAPLLIKMGFVSEEDVTSTIGQLEGISTVDLNNIVIPKKLVDSIPRDVIEKHTVMPIYRKEGQVTLAMSNLNDYEAIEEIQFLTGCKVEPILASREAIRKCIIQFYYGDETEQKKGEPEKEVEKKPLNEIEESLELGDIEPLILNKALITLLIQKNVISKEELIQKIKEISKKGN